MLLLNGCILRKPTEGNLRERVNRYWFLRENEEIVRIHDAFLVPEQQDKWNATQFVKKFNYSVKHHQIESIRISGDVATVQTRIGIGFQKYSVRNVKITNKWKWINGQWYILLPTEMERARSFWGSK